MSCVRIYGMAIEFNLTVAPGTEFPFSPMKSVGYEVVVVAAAVYGVKPLLPLKLLLLAAVVVLLLLLLLLLLLPAAVVVGGRV